MSQEKWVRQAEIAFMRRGGVFIVCAFGCDQPEIARGARRLLRIGPADHALGNAFVIHTRDNGQRAHDELTRDTHAKTAAYQLGQQETFAPVELVPVAEQAGSKLTRLEAAQGQHTPLDPLRKAEFGRALRGWQDVGDGFSQIADRLIRLFEEPFRQAGALAGELGEKTCWY